MTMRKTVAVVALALMFGVGTASASVMEGRNTNKISVGYQGQDLAGVGNVGTADLGTLNGFSVRSWVSNQVGVEGNISVGNWTDENNLGVSVTEDSVLLGTIKGLYAPVVRENSRFYVGLEAGLGRFNEEETSHSTANNSIYVVKPLIGVEYNFAGIPELGINFEVGYLFAGIHWDEDVYGAGSVEPYRNSTSGISLGWGAHYYF